MIRIEYDSTKLADQLRQLANDQIPFASSVAVNKTLKKTRNHIKSVMDNHIEGGATGFTKRGMRIYPTSKFDMRGSITFYALYGDPSKSRDYMQELMYGGVKKAKRRVIPEPNIQNLNTHAPTMFTARGNISQALYNQSRGKASKKYFRGIPRAGKTNWVGDQRLYGIWKRSDDGKKIHMLVSLKRTKRRQRKTFDAPQIAKEFFQANIRDEYQKAVILALSTMRIRD